MAELLEEIDIGDSVSCDFCSRDYTNSDEAGGLLFESKGVGPCCAAKLEASAKEYGEEQFIRDRARPGESFKAASLRWRGGNNKVRIYSLDCFQKPGDAQ